MTKRLSVLVAGRSGQVASALDAANIPNCIDLTIVGRPDLDIVNPASVEAVFENLNPELVINAAAYTAVDAAEQDAENARRLNAVAAETLASVASRYDAPILHISTDYVFDGSKPEPYTEADPVSPLGVYGQTKLRGEELVAEANPKHLILRTAWVFSVFGNNFVKTMLRVAGERDELGVVSDQIGNPTSAHDIATCLLEIAEQYRVDRKVMRSGVYHMTAAGDASWAEFAEHIFEVSAAFSGPTATVKRISSNAWPTPVRRPSNSRLDCCKLKNEFGIELPDWRVSARHCVERLVKTGAYAS